MNILSQPVGELPLDKPKITLGKCAAASAAAFVPICGNFFASDLQFNAGHNATSIAGAMACLASVIPPIVVAAKSNFQATYKTIIGVSVATMIASAGAQFVTYKMNQVSEDASAARVVAVHNAEAASLQRAADASEKFIASCNAAGGMLFTRSDGGLVDDAYIDPKAPKICLRQKTPPVVYQPES